MGKCWHYHQSQFERSRSGLLHEINWSEPLWLCIYPKVSRISKFWKDLADIKGNRNVTNNNLVLFPFSKNRFEPYGRKLATYTKAYMDFIKISKSLIGAVKDQSKPTRSMIPKGSTFSKKYSTFQKRAHLKRHQ